MVTALDISTIGLQIALPLALIASLAFVPMRSKLGLGAQIISTGLTLLCLLLISVWMITPWWAPYLYLAFWLAVAAALPMQQAIQGRRLPAANILVDITFPMGPGTYLVANGGSNKMINTHLMTLRPQTERQAAYRGQSYAVDFIKIDTPGMRAAGWRPTDPSAYAIFGDPVYAPCEGNVIRILDGQPDMTVPKMDRSQLEGNHVLIQCGNFAVLLAHLRYGSIRVTAGERVAAGEQIGKVGNSGQTTEPHLHIHVQRLPDSGPLLSGEPLHLTFDGEFPVRNDRIVIDASPMASKALLR